MRSNEVYGIITDGIATTPNEVYGVNTDAIETAPNIVYAVNVSVETTQNEVHTKSSQHNTLYFTLSCHTYAYIMYI